MVNKKTNPSFLEYVSKLNGSLDLSEAFKLSLIAIDQMDIALLKKIGLNTYEEGKWSVHKIIQHLIDWERIWCYRAVILARKEGTILDGINQEIMGANSNADELSIEHLMNELSIVRKSTIMLFESFNKKMLETNCIFFEYEIPLEMIGYTITAHQIHHFGIIKERYIPLAEVS